MTEPAVVDPATGEQIAFDEATGMPTDVAAFNRAVVADLRANGGTCTLGPLSGSPLVVLTTRGRRSGRTHETPMAYAELEDALVVVASNAAAPQHPDWFRNLQAEPTVTVEAAGERWTTTARVAGGDEREEVVAAVVDRLPFIPQHQAQVEREIPIVLLERP